MKRCFIGLLVMILIVSSVSVADQGVSLVNAIQGNPRIAIENLKIEKAKLSLESATSAQISIEETQKTFKKYGIPLEPEEALQFDLIQYTTVKRAEIGILLSTMGSQIAKNAIEIGIRELYIGTYSAYLDKNVKDKKHELATKKHKQEVQKLSKGMSTSLKVQGEALNVKMAELAVEKAKLQFNRLNSQLEQLTGQKVKLEGQSYKPEALQNEIYFMGQAENRIEVKSLKLQNDMDSMVLPYYEKDNRLNIAKHKTTYDTTLQQISQRTVQQKVAKLKVDQELERALLDIASTVRQVESLKQQVKLLEAQMVNVKKMVSKGLVSSLQLEEMAIGQMELNNAIQLVQMQYNLKRIKLNFATSVGPAYQ